MTYNAEYYQKNKEKVDARNREWREANPEKWQEAQRRWRTANEGLTYETPDGYIKYVGYAHPATTPSGLTSHHRIILWDKLNGKDVPCNWCGKDVQWESDDWHTRLVADHVNTDKQDNRPENIVPSCNQCNISRPGGQNRPPAYDWGMCQGPECDLPAKTHGYLDKSIEVCTAHYNQEHRTGRMWPRQPYTLRAVSDTERSCSACNEIKPVEQFYKRAKGKGYQNECKPCMRARTKRNLEKRDAA